MNMKGKKMKFRTGSALASALVCAGAWLMAPAAKTAAVESIPELTLAVVAESAPIATEQGARRRIRIVPFANADRHPVDGVLSVSGLEEPLKLEISRGDYRQQAYVVEIPEPTEPLTLEASLDYGAERPIAAEVEIAPYERQPVRHYVQACLDALLDHGRDAYGSISSPLVMAVLDADLLVSPAHPQQFDALVRLEERIHRRAERGSNLWYDQPLLRAMYRMSELTGEPRYAEAADQYVHYFFNHCSKGADAREIYLNGMPCWGTHVFWDCYEDRPAGDGDGNGPHEILVFDADWDAMYRVHPQGVKRTIDGIWEHHIVDKTTGLHNRHDDKQQGCDFAFSGGSFLKAFAFMYHATRDPEYLQRARTVAGWHFNNRHPETDLTADCPGLTRRYDGNHCFTTVSGPHAISLLEAYRLSGDAYFRDAATAYIKAYDRYGWDQQQQTYWAMLRLDGAPVPEQPKGSGYDAYAPYGVVDAWRPTIYSYEFTLAAGQAAILAYETSVADGAPDEELLAIAKRWAQAIEGQLPVGVGRRWKAELVEALPETAEISGGYAEDYGRTISLFVHLYRATSDERYLQLATQVANEAVDKLFHNGLFVGHPAKPYYETTNGVGLLLLALLELDSPETPLHGAF